MRRRTGTIQMKQLQVFYQFLLIISIKSASLFNHDPIKRQCVKKEQVSDLVSKLSDDEGEQTEAMQVKKKTA